MFPKYLRACTWMNKVNSSSTIYSCSMRGTDIAKVEGQCLHNGPYHSVPETQTTASKLELTLLIYFPPPVAWVITVTSLNDVTIICSTFSAGKPLHMCRGNAIIHLCICQHDCQNPQLLQLHQNIIIFSWTQISCLWHSSPGISVCPCTRVLNLFTTSTKTQAYITSKQGLWMQNIKRETYLPSKCLVWILYA